MTENDWTVDEVCGDLTLFCGQLAVRSRSEVTEVEWRVLTSVLVPGEELLTVLDQRVDSYAHVLDDPTYVRACVEDVLSHLSSAATDPDPIWPHETAEEAADCVMCSPSAPGKRPPGGGQ